MRILWMSLLWLVSCQCGPPTGPVTEPVSPGPTSLPPVDPRWSHQLVGPGVAGALDVEPLTVAVQDRSEIWLLRPDAGAWSREFVGPGSFPRLTGAEPYPTVFSASGPAVWRRGPTTAYGPRSVVLPAPQPEGFWDGVHSLTADSSHVVLAATFLVVHETATMRSYERVAAAAFEVTLSATGPELRVVRLRRAEPTLLVPRAAVYDEQGVLHVVWSEQAYSDTFEHCAGQTCAPLALPAPASVAALHVNAGRVRLVARSGSGALWALESGSGGVPQAGALVAEILDVAFAADGGAHVVYSTLGTDKRPWGEQERHLWYAVERDGAWASELLGLTDGPARLALGADRRPHVIYSQGAGARPTFSVMHALRPAD